MLIQSKAKRKLKGIRARREAIREHACKEFSIERSVKAFPDAIASRCAPGVELLAVPKSWRGD